MLTEEVCSLRGLACWQEAILNSYTLVCSLLRGLKGCASLSQNRWDFVCSLPTRIENIFFLSINHKLQLFVAYLGLNGLLRQA